MVHSLIHERGNVMTIDHIVAIGLLLIALVGVVGLMLNRLKLEKGIGEKANQFAVVSIAIPVVGALALMNAISLEITGTLLGAAIGFVANGAGK